MKKISGPLFLKKLIPRFFFGILAFMYVQFLISGATSWVGLLIVSSIFVGMTVFAYILQKAIFRDLVDEVYDDGESLLLRKDGIDRRVMLKDICYIYYPVFSSPQRVFLQIRSDLRKGKELAFLAPPSWNPFYRSRDINDLKKRIESANDT